MLSLGILITLLCRWFPISSYLSPIPFLEAMFFLRNEISLSPCLCFLCLFFFKSSPFIFIKADFLPPTFSFLDCLKTKMWGQNDNIGSKVFALHVIDPGPSPGIECSLKDGTVSFPEFPLPGSMKSSMSTPLTQYFQFQAESVP